MRLGIAGDYTCLLVTGTKAQVMNLRIDDPEGLKDFADEGYSFRSELSDSDRLLFVRDRHWATA